MLTINSESKVKIKFSDGRIKEFKLTTIPSEVNPENGCISIDSPLGKALLGNQKGNKVCYMVNGKKFEIEILDVLE